MADQKMTATARIPCRPLSYENIDLAVAKELIVDYESGNVWVKKADGSVVDVGSSVKEIVIEHIKEDPDIAQNIIINIDGVDYDVATMVAQNATNIKQLQESLGYYQDPETGDIGFDILDKVATIDPDTGDIKFNITTDDIIIPEDSDKQFITREEKEKIALATHPEVIKIKILGGGAAWTTYGDCYIQRIDVEGILETDTPVVDISLGDIYETAQRHLDSYAYIFKILTYDGYILVYASEPTLDDITIQMKLDR